jgi:DNA-binding CsgD family transcriptional regulator
MATNSDNPWNRLTVAQKRRVRMKARGMSYRQIAEHQGVCVNAIFDCLSRAEKKIPGLLAAVSELLEP